MSTADLALAGWTKIAAGDSHSIAIKDDGSLWSWGGNYSGQLGDGTTNNRSIPVKVSPDHWLEVAAGDSHSLALRSDGTLWAWGGNTSGQIGDGSAAVKYSMVQISTAGNSYSFSAIAAGGFHSLALKSDESVWGWGNNAYGQLGVAYPNNQSLPVQITGLTNIHSIHAGYDSSMAIGTDGERYVWGYNQLGTLVIYRTGVPAHPPLP